MYDIHQLVSFNLAKGTHSAGGDLCVTEAAILAAGFKHRLIGDASKAPQCFSRPITEFAIVLNDAMPDDIRNELLMPFVLRLARTRDREKVELQRLRFIIDQVVDRIGPLVFVTHRGRIRLLDKVKTGNKAADDLSRSVCRQVSVYRKLDPLCMANRAAAIVAIACLIDLAPDWRVSVEILDQAIRMGRHADLDVGLANNNIEKRLAMCTRKLTGDGSLILRL